MDPTLHVPHEMWALVAFWASDGFFPSPMVQLSSHLMAQSHKAFRRLLGGADEASVVTALRRRVRVVQRLRGTCRAFAVATWLPTLPGVWDWLVQHQKTLFPLKSYLLIDVYPLEVAANAPEAIKILALKVKLAQPPDSVMTTAPVYGCHTMMTVPEADRLSARLGLGAEHAAALRNGLSRFWQPPPGGLVRDDIGVGCSRALLAHARAKGQETPRVVASGLVYRRAPGDFVTLQDMEEVDVTEHSVSLRHVPSGKTTGQLHRYFDNLAIMTRGRHPETGKARALKTARLASLVRARAKLVQRRHKLVAKLKRRLRALEPKKRRRGHGGSSD